MSDNTATETVPALTVYAVSIEDDDLGSDQIVRLFTTEAAAEAYSAGRPERSWVTPMEVGETVPETRTYYETTFALSQHERVSNGRAGLVAYVEALRPEDVHPPLHLVFDTDAMPDWVTDVPVEVKVDEASDYVRFIGTDLAQVQVAYVQKTRALLGLPPYLPAEEATR
jgi:hypothetical protein